MLRLIFFIVLISNLNNLNAQKPILKNKIDTIFIRNDSVFVEVKSYRNDTLESEFKGYSTIDTVKLNKFPKLPGDLKQIFKVKRRFNKIVIEGDYIQYKNQGKEIDLFYNRQFVSKKYFNSDNKEIDREEFYGGLYLDCANFTGVIYIFY